MFALSLVLNSTAAQKDDLISFFDVLSVVNIDRYKLLVSNIKKAWSQKIYRDKNLEKKQYSINMSKDIGDILDELSHMEQKNKNAIIEELIREAYAKRCAI
ncbi:ribbon-helix-helix protein, CopG family [Aeromonas caviae]|uniref:ribbon-helix-helix protein, CopG family n=1 Tax=Aeromonas caviae TaxID=648 RepID=UPI0023AABB2D|nr:ribbon-helix-helix protein, CopG family [Aeromonas caviae]WEE20935.1 ribbon-helix-helix protein, CopG family [Aeromonas caviae]